MSVKVLKTGSEIISARDVLRRQGASCLGSWTVRKLRGLGLIGGINLGDQIKSWDVLNTLEFIRNNVPKSSPILDIGAYSSEILHALHRVHYTALTGIDLNPGVKSMPRANAIRYEVVDFMQTPFDDESFEAVTAISVIEHGFDGKRLLAEISRLLRPGGYFIASFDYWPDKIDTSGERIFGMDWRIFSRAEVQEFIRDAEDHGLAPFGEIDLDAGEKIIKWGGKEYTFAWMALRKNR